MKPKFIFTLGGDLGQQTISEPEGWAKIIFNIERDLTYWSLIENFEVPLVFYGTAEGKDGGYQYISAAKTNGIDTKVTIEIQISFDDGDTYEICFDGRIDLSTSKEIVYRSKIEAAIVRNDLWAIFMAKKSTPIDLLSTIDIYGNNRYGIPYREILLPSQKIRKKIIGDTTGFTVDTETVTMVGGNTVNYLIFSLENFTVVELQELITGYPYQMSTTTPESNLLFFLDAKENTTINSISGNFYISGSFNASTSDQVTVKWFIAYGNDAAGFTTAQLGTDITTGTLTLGHLFFSADTVFDYEIPFDLVQNRDQLYIYATITYPGSNKSVTFLTSPTTSSNITVIGDTTTPETTANSFLLHDVGLSICDRILGKDDSFYSTLFGGANTVIPYDSDGCGYLNALTRGLNIRGYTFAEKPFTINFDDWWNGVNPIYNIGLGYEELAVYSPGSTVIRAEKKSYFFNTTPSVFLTAINDIQIEFDLNLFTKTIEIGFEQWAAESASGIDDPQTKHTYSLRYKLFGKDEKQLSKFIAASLAIEQGRRLIKIQSNDWRLDENIFIIALKEQKATGASPSSISEEPELFTSGVTYLNNSNTRYNVRHTPARLLDRWKYFYSGQMQSYLADFFKYASGEGNVLMSWNGDTCDSGTLTENQDQSISSDYLFLPVVYSFTHQLTWDEYSTIRDNRKNAISISWILSGVTYTKIAFIKKLGYEINKSKATFEVWIRS